MVYEKFIKNENIDYMNNFICKLNINCENEKYYKNL